MERLYAKTHWMLGYKWFSERSYLRYLHIYFKNDLFNFGYVQLSCMFAVFRSAGVLLAR
jgi:hypothetical protein